MSVKVALAQLRSIGGDINKNLDKLSNYACLASKQGAQLIITPELYLTGYNTRPLSKIRDLAQIIPNSYQYKPSSRDNISVLDKIALISIKYNINIIIGLPEKKLNYYYNTAIWMNNRGKIIYIYRKQHLWGDIEHKLFNQYTNTNSDENNYKVISFNNINFGILICYDFEFVEPSRCLALNGCECILVLTALPSIDTHILNSIVISRAVENSLYIVYCDYPSPRYSGGSCCVSPNGIKIANAGYYNEALLFAEIDTNKYQDVKKRNNYLKDRRIELYKNILEKKKILTSKL